MVSPLIVTSERGVGSLCRGGFIAVPAICVLFRIDVAEFIVLSLLSPPTSHRKKTDLCSVPTSTTFTV